MAIGLMAALGAARVATGLAKGVGGAIAAKRSFSDEDRRRLDELETLRRENQLGLSEAERGKLEGELASGRGAALRQGENLAAQRGQNLSGREIFLSELAQTEAQQDARAAGAALIADQEAQATAAHRAELKALSQGKANSRAGVISALTGGVAEGATAAVDMGAASVMAQQEQEAQAILEEQRIVRAALSAGMLEQDDYDEWTAQAASMKRGR